MEVHQINVGQGHTTYVEFDDGFRAVIDVDTWEVVVDPIDYLLSVIPSDPAGKPHVDLLVVTHPHRDHASGVARFLKVFDVEEVWESGHRMECDEDWYEELIDALIEADAEIVGASSEARKTTEGGAEIRVFAPSAYLTVSKPDDKASRRDIHDQCMVVSLREGDRSLLVVGDSRWHEWKNRIVKAYGSDGLLEHELLLASHHGSRTFFRDEEEDEAYLEGIDAIDPEVVMVSVGENSHGHPHQSALDIYSDKSTIVLRTDEVGTLICRSDGSGWTIESLGDVDGQASDQPQEVYVTKNARDALSSVAGLAAGVAVGALAGGAIRRLRDREADRRPRPRHWGLD